MRRTGRHLSGGAAARLPRDLMNRRIIAMAQTLTVLLASAFVGVLAKLALRDVPPFTFVWLQIAIGESLLTLYTFQWRGERIPQGLGRHV